MEIIATFDWIDGVMCAGILLSGVVLGVVVGVVLAMRECEHRDRVEAARWLARKAVGK